MRTTVTLDSDVAEKLRAYAHDRRISFKQALNDLVRRGLRAPRAGVARKRFRVVAHRGGFRAGVDPGRLNQLADDLEVADLVREAGPRR